ncbi:MAG: TolB family protein, partial [Planctomycetota bacterium]
MRQLTDGITNDFDPCIMPNGRIMFISERRGGYGRCHGRPVPSFTLHSMNPDGTDIVMLSPHETNEWHPSVANDGMIIYTRWDYVDRGFNQAHHLWLTTPDGRDSRAIHGNFSPSERVRPHMEMDGRAIPGSHKFIATAACHHGQAYGSLVLIDPRIEDDDAMAPVRRITPDQLFPESEVATHRGPANYSSAWPLSEYFYLCVYDPESHSDAGAGNNYSIYLLDAFGNREKLYQDPEISCL